MPSGYILDSHKSSCIQSGFLTLFFQDFLYFSKYKASSIGTFSHPLGYAFNHPSRLTPIPILRQGLYFVETSLLESNTSWIPALDFTVSAQVLINSTSGKIFRILKDSLEIFSISVDSNILNIKWLLYNSSSSFEYKVSTKIIPGWMNLYISSLQSTNYLSLKFNQILKSFEIPDCEFRNQFPDLKYIR